MSDNINNLQQQESTENFAQLFEEYVQNEKQEGQVVHGTVVAIERDAVIVDVGLKSEGRIPIKEFEVAGGKIDFNVGDQIEVFIERLESRNGRTLLSREKALREKAWKKFEDIHKQELNVEGTIIGRVKGGFAVELGGIIAFLPGSQVDIRPVKDISAIIDVPQPFKILKMDREQGNVVVSRRAILEESRKEARQELLEHVSEGMTLEGTVKNITDYGAFIDLGAIDGLLHITDMSWSKISHPSEILTLGQKVKVMVIKYNAEAQRVSLGLKQLEKNPWEGLEEKYKVGNKYKGSVTTVTDYGAFVELEPNVEGLVYHTEISWQSKSTHPRKFLKAGDEVEVMILDVDIPKHRISLSMKRCTENPWEKFVEENPIGSKVKCRVNTIVDFGMFVSVLGESGESKYDIEMLVPAVELSWDEAPEEALKKYKVGDELEGVILTADIERERITIGVKQLSNEALNEAAERMPKGSTQTCKVVEVLKDGIKVELEPDVFAFVKRGELSKHRAEQRPERFSTDDRVDVKVLGYDKNSRSFNVSIKALEIEQERKAIEEYGSTDSGASLGDILGAALKGEESTKSEDK